MANIIKDFLGYLKLGEDEEFDDFLNEEEETPKRRFRKRESVAEDIDDDMLDQDQPVRESRPERTDRNAASRLSTRRLNASAVEETSSEPVKERRAFRMERTTNNKIVPIRTTNQGMEVCIIKPASFEDSQDICDMLLTGRAVVVNLEGFDPQDAQRIMDFISGSVYAMNGKLHQISRYIFIFSPDTVDISGDNLGFVADDSFEVPTLDRDF